MWVDHSLVDPVQANEFLDTTIFELLPGSLTRQQRINQFFSEFQQLIGQEPDFDDDGISGGTYVAEGFSADAYSNQSDISEDNPDGNIVRLDEHATGDNIGGQTLQSMRTLIEEHLKDIDEVLDEVDDELPDFISKSGGYLKFRNLNQGIIIRNTNSQFVEGLDPISKNYLATGFTITMWVRFLDKTSQGTLFNFGNPTREENPIGFKLETIVDINEKRYVR